MSSIYVRVYGPDGSIVGTRWSEDGHRLLDVGLMQPPTRPELGGNRELRAACAGEAPLPTTEEVTP